VAGPAAVDLGEGDLETRAPAGSRGNAPGVVQVQDDPPPSKAEHFFIVNSQFYLQLCTLIIKLILLAPETGVL